MLRRMNLKKLETWKLDIDIDKLRVDLRREYLQELQTKYDIKVENQWRRALVKFDRIFDKIIAK